MEIILYAFWAKIGWMLGEIGVGIIIIAGFLLFFALMSLPNKIKQWRCKHLSYRETVACDAICIDCGKNLGFIETQRKINRLGEI